MFVSSFTPPLPTAPCLVSRAVPGVELYPVMEYSACLMAASCSGGKVPSSTSHASLMASLYEVTSARILFLSRSLPQIGHLRWSRRRIFGMRAMRTVTRRPRLTNARWGATAPAVRSAQPASGERGAGDTSVRNILRSCSGTIAARDAHAHATATAGPGGDTTERGSGGAVAGLAQSNCRIVRARAN